MFTARFSPVSTKETWQESIEITDATTSPAEPIDLTGATISIVVEDDCGRQLLTGSTDNGKVVIQDIGIFEFTFTPTDLGGLLRHRDDEIMNQAVDLRVGCLITKDGDSMQLFIGTVPFVRGIG